MSSLGRQGRVRDKMTGRLGEILSGYPCHDHIVDLVINANLVPRLAWLLDIRVVIRLYLNGAHVILGY